MTRSDKNNDTEREYEYRDTAESADASDEEKRRAAGRMSKGIFLLVLLMFAAVIFITDAVSAVAGDTAGTIAMALIAALIAAYLYRKELKAWLRQRLHRK